LRLGLAFMFVHYELSTEFFFLTHCLFFLFTSCFYCTLFIMLLKPLELRAWEKFLKKEQRQKDQVFFRSMEDNIRNSLLRQQLIPGVPTSSTARTGPPQEPLATQPSQIRVRTISAMNEFLLSEVNGNSSSEEDKNHNHSSNNNNNDKNLSNHPGVNHNHVITPNSTATPSSSVATATLSAGSIGLTRAVSLVKGRPPLPTQRSRSHDINADVQNLAALILSPDEVPKKLKNNATQQSDSSLPEDSLAGEWLLGDLSPEKPLGELRTIHNTENMEDIANSFDKKNKSDSEKRTSPTTTPPATLASNSSSSHLRRNTESTIYVQSTMDNPDVNAMIKCVSGVYRAHIVQSLDRKTKKSPVSVSTVHVNLDLFRDDYESAGHHHLNNPMTKAPATVPDLKVIEAFYQEFYRRSQMEHDTIIMSLIYVERLIKETNGALAPTLENWRSVLFSCMILASKVWDDLSMWNIDFSNVSTATGLSSFSLQRINQLELALLTSLSFSVKVPASEYAKYYFLIRTMLIRSGLLADAALPLNKAEAKMLETRTSEYEATKLKGPREGRRARSIDWSWLAGSEPEQQQQHYHHHPPAGPVLKDKICLEHLVAK
jgi:hypothetical protein